MGKNYLFVLILSIFMTSYSNAQDFSLGVKGGGSLNKMNFENLSPDYQTDYGFSFGISGNYKFNQILSFETDLFIAQKGTKYDEPGVHYSYTLEYFFLPLLAKLYMPLDSDFNPHLDLGASINFLVNNRMGYDLIIKPDGVYPLLPVPPSNYYTSETKSLDFGIIAGLGLDVKLFSHTISLETRYEYGLTDINKGFGSGPVKNRTFSLLLGYLFY
ncbi:MAG: porin family protein [Methanococcaceae archaeon]